jgi:protein Tex
MDIKKQLMREFKLEQWQIDNTLSLIDEGNTIPFIARYRKEMTGTLSDEVLRDLSERLNYLRNLEARKVQVISAIEEQGKLTDELKSLILNSTTLVEIEDLYRPYKQKKRTRATIAKEKGLEPLALILYMQQTTTPIDELAKEYINEDLGVLTYEEAIEGAKDIIAEMISDEATYRKDLRDKVMKQGMIVSKVKDKEQTIFEMYFDYTEKASTIPGHRVLAMNRGENEKALIVKIEMEHDECLSYLRNHIIRNERFIGLAYLLESIEDSYKRLIFPSIEREIRTFLTEMAEEGAIKIFGKNLEQLLLQPPILGKIVLALDPAFRTGCKTAVIDANGKVLTTAVIYPTQPHNKIIEANKVITELIHKYGIQLIAIGNGTASRETEGFVANLLKELKSKIQYVIVNEAGASVYSASKLGTEEFPDFDVALRSAVSIGRRLQDPLAELVKIDPQSIGVGQYQHDLNQKRLSETLTGVVEDSVNRVGVDLNTASVSLLQYISGINKTIASNIVAYREANGEFKSRAELLKVAKLGPKAYEQSAGFLRIRNGKNPLDNTGVHPEAYDATKTMLSLLGLSLKYETSEFRKKIKEHTTLETLAKEVNIGVPTLSDIIKELEKPGRDPREEMPQPILRSDVLDMKDLKEGMVLKGTVRNVIDFGAFVDIGVHQDGLVHISKICNRFIKHPLEVVAIGDIVDVEVISIDIPKKRIGLSMLVNQKES